MNQFREEVFMFYPTIFAAAAIGAVTILPLLKLTEAYIDKID